MKKILQINPVLRTNTSTGRIMQEIGELAMKNGWESYVAYSRGRDGDLPCSSKKVPIGSKSDVAIHGLWTRLTDRHGLASRCATRKFIKEIERINPDIIHIHNIHGYFLNYKLFFDYLAKRAKPVIWTVHDCWLYTGHCYYYSAIGCTKWETGCGACPQRCAFPKSWLTDNSKANFRDKKLAFNSIKNHLTLAPVSSWMHSEMSRSFLKDCKYTVINNGIDLSRFKPSDDKEIRRIYNIGDRKVILGLASIWSKEKGFDDLLTLSSMLNEDEVLVMVGKMSPEQIAALPKSVISISRTSNVEQLVALYSCASAFVNPTWQDNYPTVNLEAIACGTPVVTYRTGGSVEAVTAETGYVVEQGNVEDMLHSVRDIIKKGKEFYTDKCRRHAVMNFSKEDRYQDYIDLYSSLLSR